MRARGTAALLAATGLASGLLIAAPSAAAAGSPGTITTVAGGPGRGTAKNVFQVPTAVAAGPGGVLYVGDGYIVREFSNADSFENVLAGNGAEGYSGNGGLATSAELNGVGGLAVDGSGNVLMADTYNNRVRVVATSTGTFYGRTMTAKHIYTVAGNGDVGFSGDGGPATNAALWEPEAVAVDAAGNLVIADTVNNRIRVVAAASGTFYGVAMTAGDIYTVAGNGSNGFSGDGRQATVAELGAPTGVSLDPAGNLVIADSHNARVRVVTG